MRLHDRYLFRELLTPLAYCLGGFLVFWISFFFFTELEHMQESKLRALDCIEYCAAMTPGFFVMALPIALLLALLYALTHHARHNEITALRAAGISLWRICLPYFIIGLLTVGIYFVVNEWLVPRGAEWSEKILNRYVKVKDVKISKTLFTNNGFHYNREHRIWQFNEFDSATKTMSGVNITWTSPDGSWRAITADEALFTNDVWAFTNAQMFVQKSAQGHLVPSFFTNNLAMPDFDETPRQMVLELKFSAANGLLATRGVDIPLADIWSYLHQNPNVSAKDKARLLTKFYGRIAAPWTCLVVVFIAIPFSAAPGRRNLFFGVAGSIFICFAFFVLQQVGLALGMNSFLPAWLAAWLPNLIFAVLGIFLTLRIR